jgi:RimJ/RimL family protein N-acetyltransferase
VSSQPVLRGVTSSGARVTLRRHADRDADAIVSAMVDPATRKWTPIPLDYDRDRALRLVSIAGDLWENGGGARWVVADPDDTCVGMIDLNVGEGDPEAGEVFFVAAPAARGKGYITAALRAVATWALLERGLERVEWQALVGNDGSRRVAEKAGFVFEGTLRRRCPQRGERYDAWVASMIRDDLASTSI